MKHEKMNMKILNNEIKIILQSGWNGLKSSFSRRSDQTMAQDDKKMKKSFFIIEKITEIKKYRKCPSSAQNRRKFLKIKTPYQGCQVLGTEKCQTLFKKEKISDFTIQTSVGFLKKPNYLINSPKFGS